MADPNAFMKRLQEIDIFDPKHSANFSKIATKFPEQEIMKKSAACASLSKFAFTVNQLHQAAGDSLGELREKYAGGVPPAAPRQVVKRDPTAKFDLTYTIVIEHCMNCKPHAAHTRHNEAKYLDYAAKSKLPFPALAVHFSGLANQSRNWAERSSSVQRGSQGLGYERRLLSIDSL